MSGHLITTIPAPSICCRCRAITLTGVAEGWLARVDLTPLSPPGEIGAVLAGLTVWTLTRTGLVERNSDRRDHPAGPRLPDHRCGRQIPAHHRAPAAAAAVCVETEECPF
jgi:hypothetical protein